MNDYDGSIIIGTKVDTKGIDTGINDIEKKVNKSSFLSNFSKSFSSVIKNANSGTDKLTKSLTGGMKSLTRDLSDITEDVGSIGTLIGAISLVGIIGMVALAASKSEESRAQLEQIATLVTNIINQLAQLLLPIAEEIVNFIYKAISYVGVLLEEWFGIDLFTKSASENLKSGVKSAKALKKQLMGFDEMNILNKDTGTTGVLGGIGSSKTNNTNIKTPKQAAEEFKKEVEEVVYDINHDVATQTGLGIHDWILENIPGAKFIDDKIIDPIRRLLYKTGLFEPATKKDEKKVTVITDTFVNSFKEATKKTDKMSKTLVKGAKEQFSSFTMLVNDGMVSITTSTGQTFQMAEKNFNELMKTLGIDTQKSLKVVESSAAGVVKTYSITANGIEGAVTGAFNNIEKNSNLTSNNTKTNWFTSLNNIIFKATSKDNNGLVGAVTGAFNTIQNSSNTDGESTKKSWISAFNDIINKANGKDKNGLVGGVLGAVNAIANKNPEIDIKVQPITKGFVSSILDIAKNTTAEIGNVSVKKKSMKDALTNALKGVSIGLSGASNAASLAFSVFGAKGLMINPPRLARGGIINRPGRGVPIAVGGESGREAVVPLTDSEQMAYLGREIAKHIPINLTNITELDGRVIARSVSQVMNEMNFASNGGVI